MPALIEHVVRHAAAMSARLPSAAMPHLSLAASRQAISSSRVLPLIPGLSPLLFLLPSFREPAPASAVPRARGSVTAIVALLPAAAPAHADAVHATITLVLVFFAFLPLRRLSSRRDFQPCPKYDMALVDRSALVVLNTTLA